MAETGPCQPASIPVISGTDPRSGGRRFVNQMFLIITGGAAGSSSDGWLTIAHVGNGGMLHRDSVEIDEMRFPLLVHSQALEPDTEGPGQYRGAPSAKVEYGPIDGAVLEVMYAADGSINPAEGVRGGGPGGTAAHYRRGATGETTAEPPIAHVVLSSGETIISYTTGGGGFGSPLERLPALVHNDVIEGWITRDRAREVYGVVISADGEIDLAATRRIRAEMTAS
jgi:N-methylhydantoinase B